MVRGAIPNRQTSVKSRLLVFKDFHVHGASAPEWNQRYLQMSPGVMRSVLAEWSAPGVHVFRKWMSERVVQQGGLPRSQICFALLGGEPAGEMRVNGREFGGDDILVLRGADDFEFHRLAGVELLSVTFEADRFLEFLDTPPMSRAQGRVASQAVLRADPEQLAALRRVIHGQLRGVKPCSEEDLIRSMGALLDGASKRPPERASSIAAARRVKASQEIALTESHTRLPRVEDLCLRLGTSRRTLQASFTRVTGTTPLAYLRNLRLNTVRRRLVTSPPGAPNISDAAIEAGFDHLSHFAGEYRALFGEVPSRTRRLAAR